MPRVNKMVTLASIASGLALAVAMIAPALPAEAASQPPAGVLQVQWEQRGTWPAKASDDTVEGAVQVSIDCSGYFTNAGKSFVSSTECLDPESPYVKGKLDDKFGQMLDEAGYNPWGRDIAFERRKLTEPAIAADGDAFMVSHEGKLQESVPGGVDQVFPKPGSASSMKSARRVGIAVFAVRGDASKLTSANVSDTSLKTGTTGMVLHYDTTGINRDAGETPMLLPTDVQLRSKAQASNGVDYWWYDAGKPYLMPSSVGAPVIVDGNVAGVVGINPDDSAEVPYIIDTADLRKVLKQHDALNDKPEQAPTQTPSPSKSASASPSPEITITEPPVPSESVAPTSNYRPWSFEWSWQLVLGIAAIVVALIGIILSFVLIPRKRAAKRAKKAELLRRMRAAARNAGANSANGDNSTTNPGEDQQP